MIDTFLVFSFGEIIVINISFIQTINFTSPFNIVSFFLFYLYNFSFIFNVSCQNNISIIYNSILYNTVRLCLTVQPSKKYHDYILYHFTGKNIYIYIEKNVKNFVYNCAYIFNYKNFSFFFLFTLYSIFSCITL